METASGFAQASVLQQPQLGMAPMLAVVVTSLVQLLATAQLPMTTAMAPQRINVIVVVRGYQAHLPVTVPV